MDTYQQYIHQSRYARWLPDFERRETWSETVTRYMDFWRNRGALDGTEAYEQLWDAIHGMDVMPSMRCMMTAGAALERDNVAGFNCSYLPINHVRCFDELMYILLCGTGVGFSVEQTFIKDLPTVSDQLYPSDTTIVVSDSKIGWATSVKQIINLLYSGTIPQWDTSRVRPAGSPLKTFGGRASGPEPLESLFSFLVNLFQKAEGRQLHDWEVADVCCKIADVVVVGGVRRSALICLCDLSSTAMRDYKTGIYDTPEKVAEFGHRALANISSVYHGQPQFHEFYNEMGALYASYTGERGLFNREACATIAGRNGRRTVRTDFGTNPCSEIILRPFQFCNLSEVVVRSDDTLQTLCGKVEKATILGTLQATLTDFRYLRKIWQTNTEEEALLGVSLTGIMDHPEMSDPDGDLHEWLTELKNAAVDTNKEWSDRLGINQSAAITCVKPSGTVSQLVNSASGIHPRFSPYYIRRVKSAKSDPLAQVMVEQGFPHEDAIGKPSDVVFEFPVKGPEDSPTASEVQALEQLRLWKTYQDYWCEHKPSITVYYREDDYMAVCQWVWENFDSMSGIALLPYSGGVYDQAPYEAIGAEDYQARRAEMPEELNLTLLATLETEDRTTGTQELACVGGVCEIVGDE